MSYLWMIILGFIVGAVAKKVQMPGRDQEGFVLTALLGVAGALLAGFLGQAMGWYEEGEPSGFIASVLGSMLLLFVYHLFARDDSRI